MIGLTVLALGAIGLSVLLRSQSTVATAVVAAAGIGGAVAATRMWQPVSPQVIGICLLLGLLILLRMAPRSRCGLHGCGHHTSVRSPGETCSPVAPTCRSTRSPRHSRRCRGRRGRLGRHLGPRRRDRGLRAIDQLRAGRDLCRGRHRIADSGLDGAHPRRPAAAWRGGAVRPGGRPVHHSGSRFRRTRPSDCARRGASAAVLAGIVKYALASPGDSAAGFLWPAAAVAVFAGLGLAAGLLVPETKFVPWIRLAVEWLEVLAFIVVGVLGAWLGGLFVWVRN